jgi:AraC-like DNA-binding protein
MSSVTTAFADAIIRSADLVLTEDNEVLLDGVVVKRLRAAENGYIPETDFLDLIDWVRTTRKKDAQLVEAYADSIQPDDLGVLGLAIKTAPDLGTSLKVVERYFRLLTDSAVYRLEMVGNQAFFGMEYTGALHPVLQLRSECALAAFARNMCRFVETDLSFDFVAFRHDCRSTPSEYEAVFGCPVMFGAKRDAIALPASALDLPNRLSDMAVCNFLVQHLEEETQKLSLETPLVTELMTLLPERLRHGVPQAAEIASAMGISERTLYRRLADEGLTFRAVLGRAQTDLARNLLTTSDCSIAEVAFLTGFSEQSTFSRAFKRWVGQAPGQFRQEAGAA